MKIYNDINFSLLTKLTLVFLSAICMVFQSCKEDVDSNTFFSIKENVNTMNALATGATETYTIQANGNWNIEPLRKEHWLKIEPLQGNGNGTFTITVHKNADFDKRESQLFFTVDGKLQSTTFKVEQSGATDSDIDSESYLHFDGKPEILEIPEGGLNGQDFILRATGKWRLEIEDQPSWISFDRYEGLGDTPIKITAQSNISNVRNARILFFKDDVQQAFELPIKQEGAIFFEDFNWLNYGSEIFNTTTGETRIGLWSTAELGMGWTTTINQTEGGGSYSSTYGRVGFIKLGRTSYGGDIISPKLSKIQGVKNVLVSFKAVRHGSTDHHLLTVGVIGPGTLSKSTFNVTNFASPNNTLDASRAAWAANEATYTFVITGATSETQISFLGGAFDQRSPNWPSTTNRIYLDDILVLSTN